jgi:serine phosphatase RsbU (regulator of sigma subunit)
VPLQDVPDQLSLTIADLGFAGRYVPAGTGPEPIAGDFYDVLALGPDLIAIVVGDVVGHGPAALARMLQLRAAARAYAIEQPGPASVITRLDRFCARLDPESIATLWYGEYEPSTGTLTYASAGHPPPVLHADGETRLLPRASSPPLGVTSDADAPDVTDVVVHGEVLPAGAVLVAYSDGLVERPDTDFDLQLAILQETVATACHPSRLGGAAAIAARILETLVPHPDAAHDDVCLLVVRREPTRVIEL